MFQLDEVPLCYGYMLVLIGHLGCKVAGVDRCPRVKMEASDPLSKIAWSEAEKMMESTTVVYQNLRLKIITNGQIIHKIDNLHTNTVSNCEFIFFNLANWKLN